MKQIKLDTEKVLEEFFEKNYATFSIQLPSKILVVIKNTTPEMSSAIDKAMSDVKGSRNNILQQYGLYQLAYSTVSYNNSTNKTPEDYYKIYKALPSVVIDILLKKQRQFELALQTVLTGEEIENAFFDQAGSVDEPKQQPKE